MEIIAAETGWPLDKVARYAEPPLAERAYVAERAQQVEMRRSGGRVRLTDSVELVIGPDLARAVSWDAYRRDDGKWIVVATLPATASRANASWTYDPAGPNLHPLDEPARWLMGVSDEPIIDFITDGVDVAVVVDTSIVEAEPSRPHLIAVPSIDDSPTDDTSINEGPADDIPDDTPQAAEPVIAPSGSHDAPAQGELPIEPAADAKARKSRPKGRRSSVPSWDEILFGATRGDDA